MPGNLDQMPKMLLLEDTVGTRKVYSADIYHPVASFALPLCSAQSYECGYRFSLADVF